MQAEDRRSVRVLRTTTYCRLSSCKPPKPPSSKAPLLFQAANSQIVVATGWQGDSLQEIRFF